MEQTRNMGHVQQGLMNLVSSLERRALPPSFNGANVPNQRLLKMATSVRRRETLDIEYLHNMIQNPSVGLLPGETSAYHHVSDTSVLHIMTQFQMTGNESGFRVCLDYFKRRLAMSNLFYTDSHSKVNDGDPDFAYVGGRTDWVNHHHENFLRLLWNVKTIPSFPGPNFPRTPSGAFIGTWGVLQKHYSGIHDAFNGWFKDMMSVEPYLKYPYFVIKFNLVPNNNLRLIYVPYLVSWDDFTNYLIIDNSEMFTVNRVPGSFEFNGYPTDEGIITEVDINARALKFTTRCNMTIRRADNNKKVSSGPFEETKHISTNDLKIAGSLGPNTIDITTFGGSIPRDRYPTLSWADNTPNKPPVVMDGKQSVTKIIVEGELLEGTSDIILVRGNYKLRFENV